MFCGSEGALSRILALINVSQLGLKMAKLLTGTLSYKLEVRTGTKGNLQDKEGLTIAAVCCIMNV